MKECRPGLSGHAGKIISLECKITGYLLHTREKSPVIFIYYYIIYKKVFRFETPGGFFKGNHIRQNFRQIFWPRGCQGTG